MKEEPTDCECGICREWREYVAEAVAAERERYTDALDEVACHLKACFNRMSPNETDDDKTSNAADVWDAMQIIDELLDRALATPSTDDVDEAIAAGLMDQPSTDWTSENAAFMVEGDSIPSTEEVAKRDTLTEPETIHISKKELLTEIERIQVEDQGEQG